MNPNWSIDAFFDIDGDGYVALSEFQRGTDPTDYFNGRSSNDCPGGSERRRRDAKSRRQLAGDLDRQLNERILLPHLPHPRWWRHNSDFYCARERRFSVGKRDRRDRRFDVVRCVSRRQ